MCGCLASLTSTGEFYDPFFSPSTASLRRPRLIFRKKPSVRARPRCGSAEVAQQARRSRHVGREGAGLGAAQRARARAARAGPASLRPLLSALPRTGGGGRARGWTGWLHRRDGRETRVREPGLLAGAPACRSSGKEGERGSFGFGVSRPPPHPGPSVRRCQGRRGPWRRGRETPCVPPAAAEGGGERPRPPGPGEREIPGSLPLHGPLFPGSPSHKSCRLLTARQGLAVISVPLWARPARMGTGENRKELFSVLLPRVTLPPALGKLVALSRVAFGRHSCLLVFLSASLYS